MAGRRRRAAPKDNSDRWLLTYADLITLLLAFFIVMYSMSRLDAKRFGKISEELNSVLKGGPQVLLKYIEEKESNGHGLLKLGDLKMLQRQIQKRFDALDESETVQTDVTERGLVVHIMETALFPEGSAKLRTEALEVLDLIYENIKDVNNHIRIEGHTDDRPINNEVYHSNWELSVARATSVVRYFIDNHDFPADKISALGYGEFRPRRPNNSIANRAMNRRVDIVVLTSELSMKEPTSELYNQGG